MAGENALHEPLHIPAVLDELHRQPVEQFGVHRQLALRAEVRAGFYEAHAEELLPNAVDRHARGERVLAVHQPIGEIETIVITLLRLSRQRRQKRRHIATYFFSRPIVLATKHHKALTRLGQIRHHESDRSVFADIRLLFFQIGLFAFNWLLVPFVLPRTHAPTNVVAIQFLPLRSICLVLCP